MLMGMAKPTPAETPVTEFIAVLTPTSPGTVEEDLLAIRRGRFLMALDHIQAEAKAKGLDKMTMEEIDETIAEVRQERRSGK